MANNRGMPLPKAAPKEESIEVVLDVPSELPPVEKPILFESDKPSSSERVVAPVKKGLDVIATRNGYYKQSRKVPGDAFTIQNESQLGSWMKLADPVAEKKRQAELKAKKLAGK